jgi:hypothetical protein
LIAIPVAFLAAVFWVVLRRGVERTFEIPENQRRLETIKLYWKRDPTRT